MHESFAYLCSFVDIDEFLQQYEKDLNGEIKGEYGEDRGLEDIDGLS